MTEWSLAFCGDWAPKDEIGIALESDPASFYGELLPILRGADLAVVNLEGVLADGELKPITKDGICLRFPARLVSGLTVVPFRLACLANNHSLDFGIEGLARTKLLLDERGIGYTGARSSSSESDMPASFLFGETRLAILNVAEGEEARSLNGGPGVAPMDVLRVCEKIASLRSQAEVIVVVAHAGRENLPIPAPYVREAYRAFADSGAHLVIGHHPHVHQGIESYRNSTIAYSLGNFVLWTGTALPYHCLGYVAFAKFCDAQLISFEPVPYRIRPDGLTLLVGEERQTFMDNLNMLSDLLGDDARMQLLWCAYADRWFSLQGLQDLTDSVSVLGGNARLMRSWLRKRLKSHEDDDLKDKIARRLLWHVHNRLGRRTEAPIQSGKAAVRSAAAVMRNRLDTRAHRDLLLTALGRIIDGTYGIASGWALDLLRTWQVP